MKLQIYPLLQSSYRTGHSTETALLKVHNDILLSIDKKRVTLLVLLDLSAAFDILNITSCCSSDQNLSLEYLGLHLADLNHTPMEDLSAFVLTAAAVGSLIEPMVSPEVHTLAPYCIQSTLASFLKQSRLTLRMCTPTQTILSSIYPQPSATLVRGLTLTLRRQNRSTRLVNQSTVTSIIFRQIRKFLTPASTKLLVQGVIMERIQLQRLQNSAARLLTHTPRRCLHCIGYRHVTGEVPNLS